MTSPYHGNSPAPIPGPPAGTQFTAGSGKSAMDQFAATRMTGLFERIRELEERITALEVQAAQKV